MKTRQVRRRPKLSRIRVSLVQARTSAKRSNGGYPGGRTRVARLRRPLSHSPPSMSRWISDDAHHFVDIVGDTCEPLEFLFGSPKSARGFGAACRIDLQSRRPDRRRPRRIARAALGAHLRRRRARIDADRDFGSDRDRLSATFRPRRTLVGRRQRDQSRPHGRAQASRRSAGADRRRSYFDRQAHRSSFDFCGATRASSRRLGNCKAGRSAMRRNSCRRSPQQAGAHSS